MSASPRGVALRTSQAARAHRQSIRPETVMTDPTDALVGQLGAGVVEQTRFRDERTLVVDKAHLGTALDAAFGLGFTVLTDLTAVDRHPGVPRFEVVYLLTSLVPPARLRSEEHTSELQSLAYLVCRLLLEKKKKKISTTQNVTAQDTAPTHYSTPRTTI